MLKATNMDQKSLSDTFSCQRPCEYYEFKVYCSLYVYKNFRDIIVICMLDRGRADDNGNQKKLFRD